jgi:hypothetical protein
MPVVPVPAGASPGVLTNETMLSMDSICDVGSLGAWVQVSIVPVPNGGANGGPVTPDAFGRFMHVCVEFTQPDEWLGKRRRQVPNWSSDDKPNSLRIECDPGWFWIGTLARFYLTGGNPGDKYTVTMTESTTPQQVDSRLGEEPIYMVDVFQPPCQFALTSQSTATVLNPNIVLPGPALHHSMIELVQGSMVWGGTPITAPRSRLPLSAPITTGLSTIYKTLGAV